MLVSEMGMRDVKIEKVTLNMGCGSKVPIDSATFVLKNLSGGKVVVTRTRKRST